MLLSICLSPLVLIRYGLDVLKDVGRLAWLREDERLGLRVAVRAGLVPDGRGAEGPEAEPGRASAGAGATGAAPRTEKGRAEAASWSDGCHGLCTNLRACCCCPRREIEVEYQKSFPRLVVPAVNATHGRMTSALRTSCPLFLDPCLTPSCLDPHVKH